jgi:hypothetical protein
MYKYPESSRGPRVIKRNIVKKRSLPIESQPIAKAGSSPITNESYTFLALVLILL